MFWAGVVLTLIVTFAIPSACMIYFAGQTINRLDTLTESVQTIQLDIRGKITDELQLSRESRAKADAERKQLFDEIDKLHQEIKSIKERNSK